MCLHLFQNTTKEDEEENQQSLTEEEIKAKIEEYNSSLSENRMKLVSTDFSPPLTQKHITELKCNPIHNVKTFLSIVYSLFLHLLQNLAKS